MPKDAMPRLRYLISLTALLVSPACGGSDAPKPADEAAPAAGGAAAGPAAKAPDACTFFSRAELEETVGWELREGEPEDAPPGSSVCDFETPPGMYVTRTFPNPALPKSVGFGSLTVNTHASNPEDFAQFRQTLGAEAEDVPGIGDGAYFYGPDLLYVRVGNLGFSVRIYTDAGTDADRGRVREVMLKLGRTGAGRLR